MKRFILNHPLLFCLSVAILLRGLAVVFSQGYLYSDDHFETVSVAYNWLIYTPWNADGYLIWGKTASSEIARFPLYTYLLYLMMKLYTVFGIESLSTMMYGIRAIHALVSLLSVWVIYKIIESVTQSSRWALIGGLIAGAHFILPLLSVRNLIEMIGGHIWIVAVYLLYCYKKDRVTSLLIWSGLVSGLAWMFRFQILFAVTAVPIVLLWEERSIRSALYFSAGFLFMLIVSGVVDRVVLSVWFGSSYNYVRQGLTESSLYSSSFLIYLATFIVFFIPPLSIGLLGFACVKRFWKQHALLVFPSLSFIFVHTIVGNRQERFMLPIIPVLIVIIVLVLYDQKENNGWLFRHPRLLKVSYLFAIVLNLLLLLPATLHYGHKTLIEPFLRLNSKGERITVALVSPETGRIFPFDYAGMQQPVRIWIDRWSDLNKIDTELYKGKRIDQYFIYPDSKDNLTRYLDSLESHTGKLREVFHQQPSLIDYTLHRMNPKHNHNDAVWVFEPVQ